MLVQLTLRLDKETLWLIDKLARKDGRSRNFLLSQIIETFVQKEKVRDISTTPIINSEVVIQ